MELQIQQIPNDEQSAIQTSIRTLDNELAIIADAQNGQIGSFEILIKRYEQKILLRALRITRNWQDAEDVKQQSILKAFTQLHSFQGKSSFSTWLIRIAINQALMLLRKKRTWHEVPVENACEFDGEAKISKNVTEHPASTSLPDESYVAEERKQILYVALAQLTPAMRMAIQLRELEERSTRETARILGISISAAKSRVFQGRRRLRQLLNRDPRALSIWISPDGGGYKDSDQLRDKAAEIELRPRRKSVSHSQNIYPFAIGMPQAFQNPFDRGL
jgi:RNA polymerase sigma-70 factor (ECF subfamily)